MVVCRVSEVEATLKALRDSTKHDEILFVDPGVVAPVKVCLKELQLLRKALQGILDGRLDAESVAKAKDFNHKLARKQNAALVKALARLEQR